MQDMMVPTSLVMGVSSSKERMVEIDAVDSLSFVILRWINQTKGWRDGDESCCMDPFPRNGFLFPTLGGMANAQASYAVPQDWEEAAGWMKLREVGHRVVEMHSNIDFGRLCHKEVSRELEAQPAAGHAGCDLEQVGNNTLVKTSKALLGDNGRDGASD
jgi:hypothetical protein